MNYEDVKSYHVALYLRDLNDDAESPVEKILVRQVTPTLYACQIWRTGSKEPESTFLQLDEE